MGVHENVQIFILALLGSICFIIMAFSILIDYQSKRRKRALVLIQFMTGVLMIADMLGYIYRGNETTLGFWVVRICNFLTFFLVYTELIALNKFVHTYVETRQTFSIKVEKTLYILAYIGMGLLFVSLFNGMYYYFDEHNTYNRGPLFAVSYIMPLFIIVVMLGTIVKHRKELSKHIFASGLIFTILPLVCAVMQGLFYGTAIFNESIGISAICAFALTLTDQNEYLRRIACTEKMTGLPNAHGYVQELEKRIAKGEIAQYDALYFDIVRMGIINRKYGNPTGDIVISKYVKAIKDYMVPGEVLGRLGGNFFVAIVKKERTRLFLKYIGGVDIPIRTPAGDEVVTVAAVAGVYEIPDEPVSSDQIMGNVSMAVNIAKNIQKKPFVFLTKELMQEMNEQRRLQEMIPKCLAKKEFVAFYQPKVRLSDYKLCGAEALARWKHAGEIVSPYRFIPLMEQNESICKFDFYMLNTVCADIKEWLGQGIVPPTVSVNFSRRNLGNPILAEEIYNVVNSYDIPLDLIQIEITETVDEYPISYLKGVVEALQRYGLTAAIDDFGTGSSSIKTFKEVPFDVLKIDKSFIDSISVKDRHILSHIIDMAREMKAKTISEGVETEEQVAVLKDLGCDEIQGYYFDKPLEKRDFVFRMKNPHYIKESENR